MIRIINASKNNKRLSLLMPCMYLTNFVFGLSGSGLRRYKYSAICFRTPIKNCIVKIQLDKENILNKAMAPGYDEHCFACAPMLLYSNNRVMHKTGLLSCCSCVYFFELHFFLLRDQLHQRK